LKSRAFVSALGDASERDFDLHLVDGLRVVIAEPFPDLVVFQRAR
jgi:hypothetical protein